MDVSKAIETRLEVREYRDKSVDDETKRAILDAGRLASSGRNLEHWRFILVEDNDDLDRLAEMSPTGSWIDGADFAVVICTDPTHAFHEIDSGRALTHMQLVAWEAGVGSCIYTVDNPDVEEYLNIPADYYLAAVVGFGYPTFDIDDIQGVKDRRPLSEVAYSGRFGDDLEV